MPARASTPLLLALCLLPSAALGQAPAACLVEAYGQGRGIEARAAPSPEAPVVARLPDPVLVGDQEVAVSFTVTGHVPGWFRIEEAGFSDEVPFLAEGRHVPLDGPAWVPEEAVRTTIAGVTLRAKPDEAAPESARLQGLQRMPGAVFVLFGPEGVGMSRVAACRGTWIEAQTDMGRGWTQAVCSRQRSPCE